MATLIADDEISISWYPIGASERGLLARPGEKGWTLYLVAQDREVPLFTSLTEMQARLLLDAVNELDFKRHAEGLLSRVVGH